MSELEEVTRSFRAMGSDCEVRVVVEGHRAAPILDRVEARIGELEQRWSRFLPDSELSKLNAHSGAPVFVSSDTFDLISLAIDAWRATGGLFDPTLLDVLRGLGYDRPFDSMGGQAPFAAQPTEPSPSDLNAIELHPHARMILTPPSMQIDLGGIGKGHAADLLYAQVREDGVTGACLDLGGDIRTGGVTAEGTGWGIVVDQPFCPGDDLVMIGIGEGSVATSSRLRRTWSTADGAAHHLIDPTTAQPAVSGLAAVTVVAARAAWGEAHSKAALIAGPVEGAKLIEAAGLSALFVADDGAVTMAGDFEKFVIGKPAFAP